MHGPDDDLILLARQGHRPAFERLVDRTARLVWAHLMLHTRDYALCEDLTQETFLRAWRAIDQLDAPANFRAWLLTIADRVRIDALNHNRAKKRGGDRRVFDWSVAEAIESESTSPSPADRAAGNELRGRALDALASLPAPHQQAIALRYLGGADSAEIECQLGITNGTLRGLLHRGLEMLREKLKERS